jgi:hypothetical protein
VHRSGQSSQPTRPTTSTIRVPFFIAFPTTPGYYETRSSTGHWRRAWMVLATPCFTGASESAGASEAWVPLTLLGAGVVLGRPTAWASPASPGDRRRRAAGATAAGAVAIRIQRPCTDRAGAPTGACQPA